MNIKNLFLRILKENYKTKRKYDFIGGIGDHISINILLNGVYEKNIINHIKNEIPNGNIFLDIGQNIGNHSINLSENFNYIIGFEPNRIVHQICKLNIEINDLKNINSLNFGLGEFDINDVVLTYEKNNLGTGTTNKNMDNFGKEFSSINIQIQNSEKALKKILFDLDIVDKKIDFIKIDTEGNELSIIKSLTNTLFLNKPLIMFEIEKEIISYNNSLEIFKILTEIGYSKYYTIDSKLNKIAVNQSSLKFKEYNAIFCC